MNQRIQDLAEQATKKFTTYFDGRGNVTETYFDREKFAELIVRECAELVDRAIADGGVDGRVVKEHFGVEE